MDTKLIRTLKLKKFMSNTISGELDSRSRKERFKFEALVVKEEIRCAERIFIVYPQNASKKL